MPERTRTAHVLAALAAGLLAALLATPSAVAQTEPAPLVPDAQAPAPDPAQPAPERGTWEGSRIDEPSDGTELERATFTVRGTVQYAREPVAAPIADIQVRLVDDPGDDFELADGCTVPEAAPPAITGGRDEGATTVREFQLDDVSVSCNGRYLVEVEAQLVGPDATSHTMTSTVVVAERPPSVTGLEVALDGEVRSVTVTFQPLDSAQVPIDVVGYVLERSSSGDESFIDVAAIGFDDDPSFVDGLADAPADAYTYRVRAVRAGAAGDVRSSVGDTETDTVEVEGEPPGPAAQPRSATGAKRGSGGVRPTGGRTTGPRTAGPARSTTATTLDTGFEDTLDYGDGEGADEPAGDELAGDEPVAGQSIVRAEGTGMGLAVPAAGALVMLGWAGHILYLNRLAKQL